jgi:tRNA(His) guanylyltransferase
MLAQANFSQKELNGKGMADMHEMLHTVGVNWVTQPEVFKNGSFIKKDFTQDLTIKNTYKDINKLVVESGAITLTDSNIQDTTLT